jgi:EAL domain-containing protein (putative c-di-GMP-specific phosphodiesterase class I)/DNA-binding response OmpR family regulator
MSNKTKIVIAEDEPDIRTNLKRMLGLEGFEVWAGQNGLEALELIRQHGPDLILSDVMMPEMTGHQLIQALRQDQNISHIPVILLTARADRQDVRDGMNLGADDYLTKPFQREELLGSIRSRLEKVSLQQLAAQRLAAQSHHLAHHDRITDLPNRTHFLLLLNAAMSNARLRSLQPVLWAIGLDNLPEMTQVLSSGTLAECVCEMANRVHAFAKGHSSAGWGQYLLSRPSDDRFVLMFEQPPSVEDLSSQAQALLSTLTQPIASGSEQHFPRISMGVLNIDQHDLPSEVVMGRLDITLSQARQHPVQKICFQTLQSSQELGATFKLHNDLHLSVERNQLRALYQPQIDAQTHALLGFEALMRWEHHQSGLISPAQFIPLAEDNGQIVPMGRWILQAACTQAALWNREPPLNARPIRMAVNLSLRQFGDPDIVKHVEEALEKSGLPAELLELEITEGTAMLDLQHTLKLLGQFKRMGVQLAIDDFGTGYSSLAYLKRFPLDVLKIDQSFVRNLCTDPEDKAIARAVITLAHSLDMRVIAEGVEQVEQHRLLTEMGCNEIQGYLHGKPMPAEAVPGWLALHLQRNSP